MNEYKKVFQANSTFSKFNNNKIENIEYFTSGIFDSSDDFMKTIESELNSNTYDENKMKETLKNRKNKNLIFVFSLFPICFLYVFLVFI